MKGSLLYQIIGVGLEAVWPQTGKNVKIVLLFATGSTSFAFVFFPILPNRVRQSYGDFFKTTLAYSGMNA